ncbi:MAG TPA: TAXI family TRAP transporter solute-binding subunit [Rhodocyclaceae bacterium]|jgi:TRAP transporter TAXI family solute receptor|nr:TAXI family TRAP transporter solute-binding subunit [Betaproteobacteria bacterium]HMV01163.1 TAXI family TRAP transporter solute-binding subunit [Rhodocyclaceae bacterium]HMV21439.1 TAXI family TRAP transporter solute-binding subunit [Rhodocyclaceae bacterium]HMW76762.1 TAXI family TRAP transporter solute-binding subunit [Rhodocyclaceae bacterium]HNE42984.1 TAXI family TRAP transporter solute-binding subunit [Rhodocyclaceae bacterium]
MMARIKAGLLSLRDLLATAWWIVLVVGIGFVVAYQFVQPAPPSRIVITTGGEAGAYFQFAKRYAAILARDGITLEVKTSAGSLQNLDRLKAGEADIAFVQGGVVVPVEGEEDDSGLLSLGSMFYEPVWVFYRGANALTRLTDLRGKRIAIGQEGSGVRQLAQQLLDANEIDPGESTVPLSGLKAAEELQQGRIDAAFIIAAENAPVVQVLLRSPGVRVMSFSQASAYQRRFPFLTRLTFPHGVADLVRDFPPDDIKVLAPTANLVVRSDLHPALQSLLLQAASEVHGKAGFFQDAGEFPAYKDPMLPLSAEAARYYKAGPPFLQRYLPFWLAVLADRLIVMLVPIVALLIPLIKIAPALYSWRIRSKIFRCYGELKFLEDDLKEHFDAERLGEYRSRLDALDDEASRLRVPLAFTDLVYTLRGHVNLVRKTLDKLTRTV